MIVNAGRKKSFIKGFVWILSLVLFFSAAFAEDSGMDAEKNLAEYGLNPEDVILERFGFVPEENRSWLWGRQTDLPIYLWFDVTGDGCVDLCSGRMVGSGMVRIDLDVYDPLNRKSYNLDGYDYYFMPESVSGGRLNVIKRGPYGYGHPISDVHGSVILDHGILVFIANPEPGSSGSLSDAEQAPVSADLAVRIALAFAKDRLGARYFNEVTVSCVGPEDGNTGTSCWVISLYWISGLKYSVSVNTETGEVENSRIFGKGAR